MGTGKTRAPKKIFSSNCHVKFRNFVNFSYIFFWAMSCPPKLTELLCLWLRCLCMRTLGKSSWKLKHLSHCTYFAIKQVSWASSLKKHELWTTCKIVSGCWSRISQAALLQEVLWSCESVGFIGSFHDIVLTCFGTHTQTNLTKNIIAPATLR